MSNICELLINVVNNNKPKVLGGLDQKVRGMVKALYYRFTQSVIPPADRQALTHLVELAEHGKPNCLHFDVESDP
jgi:UDP-N-acetyl-D-mannosaminuronate dehydrogenase